MDGSRSGAMEFTRQGVKRMNRNVFLLCVLLGAAGPQAAEQPDTPSGTIRGRLSDAETRSPLAGANVILLGTRTGAVTDVDGGFVIQNAAAGSYSLQCRYMGYEPATETDVIVRPRRVTFVEVGLKLAVIRSGEVKVKAGYFRHDDEQPLSLTAISREEIRRAPGSAGDVSRILMTLPAVAKVNDQSNALIVRGGSPVENAFFIDNIEIPNINHFPTQGATGGPIGMVNVDFIQDVRFHSGGFSAAYGDRLSSVMDISFREGNRNEFDGQLDLNFAGFGGVAEGPFGKKGSWLFSARRSYLDLLVKAVDVGTAVAPRYGDTQWKIVRDVHPRHKIEFLGIWGDDENNPDRETAVQNDMSDYGYQDHAERTTGITWRALWGVNGYSNTSVSTNWNRFREDYYETNSGRHLVRNRSWERAVKFRNSNRFRLHPRHSLEFGLEIRLLDNRYDNAFDEYTDAAGEPVAALPLSCRIRGKQAGAFVDYIARPFDRLTATFGVRGDCFSFTDRKTLSPRFSFSYRLDDLTSLTGSAGLYRQTLPLILLAQDPGNRRLESPSALQGILGISRLLTENTKLTVEAYEKRYRHFPIDPSQPSLFLIDELYYRYGFFFNHGPLTAEGEAESRGLEVTVQKKLAADFYGLASASYSKSRTRGGDGIWRDRVFDNRFMFSVEGGYKPNRRWEFSLRWIYAGGTPYTPFDIAKTRALNREVLDENRINTERYPDYHSMNLRFDRRFLFRKTNLVFYFSIWNVYGRRNVATYFWNGAEQKQETIYQWGILPIFGLEWEF
jgi:hypothetical protein